MFGYRNLIMFLCNTPPPPPFFPLFPRHNYKVIQCHRKPWLIIIERCVKGFFFCLSWLWRLNKNINKNDFFYLSEKLVGILGPSTDVHLWSIDWPYQQSMYCLMNLFYRLSNMNTHANKALIYLDNSKSRQCLHTYDLLHIIT